MTRMTQGGRVRLALLDHISSPSALLFPIGKAVLMLRRFFIIRDHQNQNSIISIFIIIDIGFRHGVEVLVDGAHTSLLSFYQDGYINNIDSIYWIYVDLFRHGVEVLVDGAHTSLLSFYQD